MTIKQYVQERKEQIKNLVAKMEVKPSIAIVQVNEDVGSHAYVRGKLKDAEELGIKADLIKLDINTTQDELLEVIHRLNQDETYDGFIVQMPLPKGIDENIIKLAISPKKDVDGFHPLSSLIACTPKGILNYLKSEQIPLLGKNAVVIGRSNIVGKPMAKLLLKESMNVTVLHSKTTFEDMAFYVAHADVIVIAIGKTSFLDHRFNYKKDAVIVDVGINRTEEGLKGDALRDLPVKLQTPVPGGVGLLTRLALYENLLEIKGINE
ncbi:MAG TPA: bifunctional 5,10-methylenetetrahydrofolate dehydrogenase/5,10-methenyltetrahydrofolate cyclohydrolase [Erysipelotrichaceae bacterium]|nr:bifunctional 5,10-methylenetetrahydrofolate dehydrogenase/5,10-methenyltetrahydrofolate cyclohydrolase [Erysipelotrichaceae bacterium]